MSSRVAYVIAYTNLYYDTKTQILLGTNVTNKIYYTALQQHNMLGTTLQPCSLFHESPNLFCSLVCDWLHCTQTHKTTLN